MIKLFDPNINIMLNMGEEDFLESIGLKKNESRFYSFISHLTEEHIKVQVFVEFKDDVDIIQIVTVGTKTCENVMLGTIYMNPEKTNLLSNYVTDNFGKPSFLGRIFSKINKPFYIYKWKFSNLRVTHKYQDSHDGLAESSTFYVVKKVKKG